MPSQSSPMPLHAVRALCFDMDGVLIDSMPAHADAWIAALQEVGVRITRQDVYAREGEPGATSLADFLRQAGREPDPGLIERVLRAKERRFKQGPVPPPFPGVRELVAELRRRGKRLALVTGTALHELQTVLPADLREQFEILITGDQVHKGKPDPEPYLLAVKTLGVRSQETIVIENAPLGLRSAKAAGLYCLVVETSNVCHQLSEADQCFPDLPSLSKYLLAGI